MAKPNSEPVDLSKVDLHLLRDLVVGYRARLLFHRETLHLGIDPSKKTKAQDQQIEHKGIWADQFNWVAQSYDQLRSFLDTHMIVENYTAIGNFVRINLFAVILEIVRDRPRFSLVSERPFRLLDATVGVIDHLLHHESGFMPAYSGKSEEIWRPVSPLEVNPVAPVVRVKKTGNEHPLTDKQWRILKLLNEIPGRVLSSSDLGKLDADLEGSKCYRMVAGLPEEVKKHIGRARGKGMRILCGVSSA